MSFCPTSRIFAAAVVAALAVTTPSAPVRADGGDRVGPTALDLGAMLLVERTSETVDRVVLGIVVTFAGEADAQAARASLARLRLRDAAGTVLRDVRAFKADDPGPLERRLMAALPAHAPRITGVTVELLGRTSTIRD